jgi:hypothetical protein
LKTIVFVGNLLTSSERAFRAFQSFQKHIASIQEKQRMKSLRIVVAFVLAFGLTAGCTQAQAATKKAAVVTQAPANRVSSAKNYVNGTTQDGRIGMFFTQAAEAPAVGHGNITAAINFASSSGYSAFDMPSVGINYGIVKNMEIAASLPLRIVSPEGGDSQIGLGSVSFGGKYVIPSQNVNFGVGLDIALGPISEDLGWRTTVITPKGLVTYRVPGSTGIVLNGEFGIGFWSMGDRTYDVMGYRVTVDGGSDSFIQVKAGVGIPFTKTLTGIGELGVNQFGDSGSAMAFGIRTGTKTKLQALVAVGLGDGAPDVTLGGAVAFGL